MAVSGDLQGKVMTEVQPMKMAAAEALYDTEQPAAFSIFTIGSLDGSRRSSRSRCPTCCRSWPPGPPTARSQGINELREKYQEKYGSDPGAAYYSPGDYTPIIPLTYWTFRLMIGPRLRWPRASRRGSSWPPARDGCPRAG